MKEFTCDLAGAQTRFDEARKNLISAERAVNPNRIRSFFGKLEHRYLSNLRYSLSLSSVDFENAAFNLDVLTREQEILAEADGLTLIKTEEHLPERGIRTRVVIEGQIKNRILSMSLEKIEETLNYQDHSWRLTGSIDGKDLRDGDAAVLWAKYYTVLRRDEIRKERRKKEEAEALRLWQRKAIDREKIEAYKQDVQPLIDELIQN